MGPPGQRIAVTNELTTKAVCDAGPLIHLDELNCLDLLSDFQEILLSNAVREEIEKYRPSALTNRELPITVFSQNLFFDETLLTISRAFALDQGEIEALALMRMNRHAIFLTDDAAARLAADQMGYRAHGTMGILIRAIRRKQRKPEEILSVLAEVSTKSTLHIKGSLLEEITSKVRSEFHL
jgi:predicted nucleic acid-binding protein